MINFLIKVIAIFGGDQFFYTANADKAGVVLASLAAIFVVGAIFVLVYLKYFWESNFSKKIFWVSAIGLPMILLAKYAIFFLKKGYIADRFLFYALPSPKAEGWAWLVLAMVVVGAFLFFRERIEKLKTWQFLGVLWLTFVVFGVAVAGIRDGSYGVYEPFTRAHWEYAGDLPLIKSAGSFLQSYTAITSQLSLHGQTHPPGYALFLYLLSKIFSANLFVLSFLVGAVGGLTIIPLYFFANKFWDDFDVRRVLQIFIFLPSVVMFSFASMEAVMMFFAWIAFAVTLYGWTRSYVWAFLGGIFTGLCFMFNFLFALTLPIFIFIFLRAWSTEDQKYKLILRVVLSSVGVILFFALLYWLTGYSIIENFFVARGANQEIVHSNFESLGIYLTYFFMNIFAISFYSGVVNFVYFMPSVMPAKAGIHYNDVMDSGFRRNDTPMLLGPSMILFFSLIGIFQGEVERIWLFLAPLFVMTLKCFSLKVISKDFSAVLLCSVLQVILLQILFYTYW